MTGVTHKIALGSFIIKHDETTSPEHVTKINDLIMAAPETAAEREKLKEENELIRRLLDEALQAGICESWREEARAIIAKHKGVA